MRRPHAVQLHALSVQGGGAAQGNAESAPSSCAVSAVHQRGNFEKRNRPTSLRPCQWLGQKQALVPQRRSAPGVQQSPARPPARLREPASAHRRRRPGTPLRACGRASGQRMRSPRKAPAAPPPATPTAASMGPPRASHTPSRPLPVRASCPCSGHADRLLGPLQQLRREVVGELGQRAERALARGRRLDAKPCARGTGHPPVSRSAQGPSRTHKMRTCGLRPNARAYTSAKPFCWPLSVREAKRARTPTVHTQRQCRAYPCRACQGACRASPSMGSRTPLCQDRATEALLHKGGHVICG